MYVWHEDSFSKRLEFYLKPLEYVNVLVDTPVLLKLPPDLKPYLSSPYDLVIVDEFFEEALLYCLDSTNLIYSISSSFISSSTVYRFFVYYGAERNIRKATHLIVRFYKRDTDKPHPSNHSELVDVYTTEYKLDISRAYTELDLGPFNVDYVCIHVSAWFYVNKANEGEWSFAIDSDDSGEVSIDDTIVASWYGGHGVCSCYDHNGSLMLTEGWHKLVVLHEDATGGEALRVYFKNPSDSTWKKFSTNALYVADVDYNEPLVHSYKFIEYGYYDMFIPDAENLFPKLDIINLLNTNSLTSLVGQDLVNNGAAVEQAVCEDFIGITTTKDSSTYVYCDTNTFSEFSVFLGVRLTEGTGNGVLLYLDSNIIVFVDVDRSLSVKLGDTVHDVDYLFPNNSCGSVAVTYNGSRFCLFINGQVIFRQDTSGLSSSYLSVGGAENYNSVSAGFFYLFKFGYMEPYVMDYLHSTLFGSVLQVAGYDSFDEQCILEVDPSFVTTGENNTYRLVTTSGCTECSITIDSLLLCSGVCDDVQYTLDHAGYHTINYTCGSGIKVLEVKVNDIAGLSYDITTAFSSAESVIGTIDILNDTKFRKPYFNSTEDIPIEYQFDDKNDHVLDIFIEFYLYSISYPQVLDVPVEFYFTLDLETYFYDITVFFVSSSFYAVYFKDVLVEYQTHTVTTATEDIISYFNVAASEYYDYLSDIIVSESVYYDTMLSVATQSGTLHRYISDVIVSDQVYSDVWADTVVASEMYFNYRTDTATTSGLLQRYQTDVVTANEVYSNVKSEIRLNSIEFHNFSIGVDDVVVTDDTYSIDIIDKLYGIDISTINITINGNLVTSVSYVGIVDGYHVVFSDNLFSYTTSEVYEFRIYIKNLRGDEGLALYYVRRGYRFTYNKHHMIVHDYNQVLSVLLSAENDVAVFSSRSSENIPVLVETQPYRSLSASIVPVGGASSLLEGSITAASPNFYPGGSYTVVITCKDFAGNEMPPFEFTFTIRSDGT